MWASSNILPAAQTFWGKESCLLLPVHLLPVTARNPRGTEDFHKACIIPSSADSGWFTARTLQVWSLPPGSKQCSVGRAITNVLPGWVKARPTLLTSQPCSCFFFSGRWDGALPGCPGFILGASGCLATDCPFQQGPGWDWDRFLPGMGELSDSVVV